MANEKRLIDANASICKKCDHYLVCKYADNQAAECSQYKAPTVDAVEVVRCKKCKSFTYDGYHKHYYCSNAKGMRYAVLPDGFCSHGERKDNDSK